MDSRSLIPLAEAQAQLLAMAPALRAVSLPLSKAVGRNLSEDIVATRDQPAADLSAMDGYAISAKHNTIGPWPIIGASSAGQPFVGAFDTSSAVRIFTGAVLPKGADTVIMQENVNIKNSMLHLKPDTLVEIHRHVRPKAGEFSAGDVLVSANTRISPAIIGLIAAAGRPEVAVFADVKVALIATGNELIKPGEVPQLGQITSTNDVMLSALLARAGVELFDPVFAADDLDALCCAITNASEADIIITIGGASVGDHDLVRPALESLGADLGFWKVAMKPGKPVMAGRLGTQIIIGLPGNPVSAYVTALLFAMPLIAKCLGDPQPLPRTFSATLGADVAENGSRADHIRAWSKPSEHGPSIVLPIGMNDSAALTALAKADCLIVRSPFAPAAKAGENVTIIKLT
jgi:molybdopterin molybdotransferase